MSEINATLTFQALTSGPAITPEFIMMTLAGALLLMFFIALCKRFGWGPEE